MPLLIKSTLKKKGVRIMNEYERFGFVLNEVNSEGTIWKLDISQYKNKNKFIKVEND